MPQKGHSYTPGAAKTWRGSLREALRTCPPDQIPWPSHCWSLLHSQRLKTGHFFSVCLLSGCQTLCPEIRVLPVTPGPLNSCPDARSLGHPAHHSLLQSRLTPGPRSRGPGRAGVKAPTSKKHCWACEQGSQWWEQREGGRERGREDGQMDMGGKVLEEHGRGEK